MSEEGFYLVMLAKRDAAETALWQCYNQLFTNLGYFNKHQVTIDGKSVPLTQETMATTVDGHVTKGNRDGFFIFRQHFIHVFEDGSLMLQLIKDACTALEKPMGQLNDKQAAFASKSNPLLRTVYWYIDKHFITQLPPAQQASFTVDCLMFGEWECKSFNLIGMHLVALACMLEAKELATFLPPEAAKHAAVVNPYFKGFLAKKAITLSISFKDVRTPVGGSGAGAGTAKTLDKGANDKKAGKEAKDAKDKDAKGKDAKGKDAKDKDGKGKDAKGKDAKDKDAKGKDAKGKDAKGKEAKDKDAKGKDAKGKDVKAKDAKDKDAKSKDAKGKDAKGKDAKGKDAKGKDAKANTPAKK
ncbi:hypothetical protein BOX15_Mlig004787g3 [Macrostomum lignano]|uniref:Uncharacterized protein n=2 Tax=Macrostomum lignano TaxID=282301 RepID=A0A267ECG2_9PLAT|nr:hypothetical protein BOX15_Mlig004787g3 [Macrostomum lignano]